MKNEKLKVKFKNYPDEIWTPKFFLFHFYFFI